MVQRREVIDHLTWVYTQWMTGRFIDDAINVIELAAADREDQVVEIDCERLPVREAVRRLELEDLVERVRQGEAVRHGPDLDDDSNSYDNVI